MNENKYEEITFTCDKGTYYKIKSDLMKAEIEIYEEHEEKGKVRKIKVLREKSSDALKVIGRTAFSVVGENAGW